MMSGQAEVQVAAENRVGQRLEYLDDAKIGETLHFYYEGGSEDGYRTVRVLKVDGGDIEGPTLERENGYRRYSDVHASDITIVEPFFVEGDDKQTPVNGELRVRFDDAGTKLLASLSGEQLAELYSKYVAVEGEGAAFDAERGEVVVKLPEPPKPVIDNVEDREFSMTFGNKRFTVYLYPGDETIGVDYSYDGDFFSDANVSPELLGQKLAEFLSK